MGGEGSRTDSIIAIVVFPFFYFFFHSLVVFFLLSIRLYKLMPAATLLHFFFLPDCLLRSSCWPFPRPKNPYKYSTAFLVFFRPLFFSPFLFVFFCVCVCALVVALPPSLYRIKGRCCTLASAPSNVLALTMEIFDRLEVHCLSLFPLSCCRLCCVGSETTLSLSLLSLLIYLVRLHLSSFEAFFPFTSLAVSLWRDKSFPNGFMDHRGWLTAYYIISTCLAFPNYNAADRALRYISCLFSIDDCRLHKSSTRKRVMGLPLILPSHFCIIESPTAYVVHHSMRRPSVDNQPPRWDKLVF